MKKKFIFFIIIFIYYVTNVNAASECSDFEAKIREKCNDLSSPGEYCYYSDNECKEWYQDCEDYNPDTYFDDKICTKIIPINPLKKCVVKNDEYDENKKWCVPENKKCEDHNYKDGCVELETDTNKRCVLFNGECKAHFNDCSENNLNEKEKCENNIPRAKGNKCIWNELTSICQAESRKCKDYIKFEDINGKNKECPDLEYNTDSGAVCYWNKTSNICTEGYLRCEYLTDKTKCQSIIPLNDERDGFHNLLKCVPTNSECETKNRICDDYKKREEDTEETCEKLIPKDASHIGNKMCYLNENNNCEEIYITCNNYNLIVTKPEDRRAEDCTKIKPITTINNQKVIDVHSKCKFESQTCSITKKECEEFNNDEENCNERTPNEANTECIYKNNICKKIYKSCDNYKTEVGINNIDQENCELIRPFLDNGKYYRCVFSNEEGQGKDCKRVEIDNCEDYKGNEAKICKDLSKVTNDTNLYNCIIKNDKCITQYKDCSEYNKKDKKTCESIILYNPDDDEHPYNPNPYERCFFENDQFCRKRKKLCNEYKGNDEKECSKFRAAAIGEEEIKICVLEENKCIEKYKEKIYKYCSDYKGTDKLICESIQPYNTEINPTPDYTAKCVYGKEGCERVSIECDKARDIYECNSIVPTDTNKMCIYKDNKCIEQFRTCKLYEKFGGKINKETCESIIIDNNILLDENTINPPSPPYNNYIYKCEFYQGTENDEDDPSTCTHVKRKCKDFKNDLIISECKSISLLDPIKKCSYINNICTSVNKTCLELKDINNAVDSVTDEICSTSLTSSEAKICVLDIDENEVIHGCKEEDNPNYIVKTKEKKNSGGNTHMNLIILLLLFLLI